ncbi:MAG TPA: hypothetical protein VLB10_08455 [Gammaproteobacteria bacterium]|jgi:hypothetical protein|nr:hypothetical protein [Gammaproteobacteria bacterium]
MSRQLFDPTRRRLLGALALLLAGCSDVKHRIATGIQPDATGPWERFLLMAGDRLAAANIGRHYLAAHPAQATAGSLVDSIGQALFRQHGETAGRMDSARLAHALRELVVREYTDGRVVTVSGWVLSITEARLYGLAAAAEHRWCQSTFIPYIREKCALTPFSSL